MRKLRLGETRSRSGETTAKIFISYSRRDLEFADRIEAALKVRGFDTLIDRSEIYALEDWWKRIEALITQADTIVFILSPDAVASDVCQSEVRFAASLNKRLAPIVYRRVDDKAVPAELGRLNYIFFDEPALFDESLERLAEALETDIAWVRKHTEFGEQARRWAGVGRPGPRGLLLRPPVLDEAERWIASRPHNAPMPTEAARAFIAASRQAHTRRRNIVSGSLAAGLLVALLLSGFAFWQRQVAVEQKKIAVKQRNEALLSQSRFLEDRAFATLSSNPELAGLIARAALPTDMNDPDRPLLYPAVTDLTAARASSRLAARLIGHSGSVSAAVWSPDGTRIVTGSDDSTVRVWDGRSGAQLKVLQGQKSKIINAIWSPDGTRVAASSEGGMALVWNAKTGVKLFELQGHGVVEWSPDGTRIVVGGRVYDASTGAPLIKLQGKIGLVSAAGSAWSPDSKRIVTGSDNDATADTSYVLDATTGAQIATLKGHTKMVLGGVWSPDGTQIVTASFDGTARVWDGATGAQLAVLKHLALVLSAEWSPDGSRILTASVDNSARVWDAKTGTQLTMFPGPVFRATWSSGGLYVVTASINGTSRLWDAKTGTLLAQLDDGDGTKPIGSVAWQPSGTRIVTTRGEVGSIWNTVDPTQIKVLVGHDDKVSSASWSPDGKRIVTASFDKTARVWDAETGNQLAVLQGHTSLVVGAAWSPDGKRVATASSDKTARLWDAATGTQLALLQGHDDVVASIAWSPDGSRVLTASWDKTAGIWDSSTGAEVAVLRGHTDKVTSAVWSPDGARVVTGSIDGTARLWDAKTGKQLSVLRDTTTIQSVAWSPDGAFVVSASAGGTAQTWDGRTGAPVIGFLRPGIPALDAAFSPDGSRIATAFKDGVAYISDAKTAAQLTLLQGHVGSILRIAWSPDGTRVLTASVDGSARVWDVQTGAELAMLRGHRLPVVRAEWSPDGKRILTASWDHTARIWDAWSLTTADTVAYADVSAMGALTDNERAGLFLSTKNTAPRPAVGAGDENKNDSGPACDRLAGNSVDPKRTVPIGMQFNDIDPEKAIPVCKAAAQASPDEPRFEYELGRALQRGGKPVEAIAAYREAASKHYPAALFNLGLAYEEGNGVTQDQAEALRLLRAATAGGLFEADAEIANFYWDGEGIAADREQAVEWLRRGAADGDPFSHRRLAELHESGDGVKENLAAAVYHHAIEAHLFQSIGDADDASIAAIRRGSDARAISPEAAVRADHAAMAWQPEPQAH
ncbi:MAG TPA: TIR domain-containing protein [Xanthobacteraceae bacterium]|nr:TIR domain-containing protein [Xanthobacteraceae bacterium]